MPPPVGHTGVGFVIVPIGLERVKCNKEKRNINLYKVIKGW